MPPSERVTGRTLLSAQEPTVTLTRRQSALGSLVIAAEGAGELGAIWELEDGTAGIVGAHTGVHVSPEYARRPIVEYAGHRLIAGLRHVRELRRLLVLLDVTEAEAARRLALELYDGATIETSNAPAPGGTLVAAIALYQVDGELVIRREHLGFATASAAAEAFGFTPTWLPPMTSLQR